MNYLTGFQLSTLTEAWAGGSFCDADRWGVLKTQYIDCGGDFDVMICRPWIHETHKLWNNTIMNGEHEEDCEKSMSRISLIRRRSDAASTSW